MTTIAVRTRKVREHHGRSAYIVVTRADGDSLPLGGPRLIHIYNDALTPTGNHSLAVELFGSEHLGMRKPHAEDCQHKGYGTYRWTVTDYGDDSDESPDEFDTATHSMPLEALPELPEEPPTHATVPLDLLRTVRTELLLAATNPRSQRHEQDRIDRVYRRLAAYVPLLTS